MHHMHPQEGAGVSDKVVVKITKMRAIRLKRIILHPQ